MLRSVMKKPEVQLHKFRPSWGVAILVERLDEECAFLQTWALAQLMAWAILDQKPGKRQPKGTPSKRRIGTRSAKQAGHITLAHLLDRRIKRGAEKDSSDLELMLHLFLKCGGFAACFQSWGEQKSILCYKKGKKGSRIRLPNCSIPMSISQTSRRRRQLHY